MKEIEFKGKAMEYFGIWLANILNCSDNWYFQRLGKSEKLNIF